MKRDWTLLELLTRFPDVAPYGASVLRCTRATRAVGRHEAAVPPHEVAEVSLGARPTRDFVFTYLNRWPPGTPVDEEQDLDAAVLRGLLRGAAEVAHPPWRSAIVCETIGYVAGRTTPAAVEQAMVNAVQSLVSRGQWIVEPEIGLATLRDLPLLPEIERRASKLFLTVPATAHLRLTSPTPLEVLEAAHRSGLLWVARLREAPVGFALVGELGNGLHLEELDVLPECGRQGIGRALVDQVCRYARERGRTLTLCTFKDVPWNAPFYTRLGFRVLSPDEMSPLLRQRIAEEATRGLPSELRVVMTYVGHFIQSEPGSTSWPEDRGG